MEKYGESEQSTQQWQPQVLLHHFNSEVHLMFPTVKHKMFKSSQDIQLALQFFLL